MGEYWRWWMGIMAENNVKISLDYLYREHVRCRVGQSPSHKNNGEKVFYHLPADARAIVAYQATRMHPNP